MTSAIDTVFAELTAHHQAHASRLIAGLFTTDPKRFELFHRRRSFFTRLVKNLDRRSGARFAFQTCDGRRG